MASEGSVNVSGGIGLTGLLFVAFLVLKLCGVIAWSWWWVTAPLWVPFALVIGIALLIFIVILIKIVLTEMIKKRKRK